MSEDFLGDRRKALEESFFRKQNDELRRKMQEKQEARASKQALSEASGITDEAVLDRLVGLGIRGETLAALSLVPLVEVAWADGKIESKERRAILEAAERSGLRPSDVSHELLEEWLGRRPDAALLESWKAYVSELAASLSPEAAEALKSDLLGRARAVAEAAGGVLGLGSKVSREEQEMLEELEKAFA